MSSRPDPSGALRTLRLVLDYDGRRFDGWHDPRAERSIAAELARCLEKVLPERPLIQAAAPTDPGVHAEAQVVSLRTQSAEPARRIGAAVEAELPGDLGLVEIADAGERFQARLGITEIHWRFQVVRRRAPLDRGRAWLIPEAIDLARLEAASKLILGKHDLAAFADRQLVKSGNTRATLSEAAWTEQGSLLVLHLRADRLHSRTVRRLIGSLVAVGRGAITLDEFRRRLESAAPPSKKAPGFVAPPPGLFLAGVVHDARFLETPLEGGPTAPTATRALGALDGKSKKG
jgi:tRNA pseudouridine38-40 synthase